MLDMFKSQFYSLCKDKAELIQELNDFEIIELSDNSLCVVPITEHESDVLLLVDILKELGYRDIKHYQEYDDYDGLEWIIDFKRYPDYIKLVK